MTSIAEVNNVHSHNPWKTHRGIISHLSPVGRFFQNKHIKMVFLTVDLSYPWGP
jgi:hypothetical protein